jgi:predicted  nucleic acid-binding Zn-ribbon protein
MTNIQLLLSIGIPSLIVVASMLNSNWRFSGIDKRLDTIEKRLDGHDAKFEAISSRFEGVNDRFEGLNLRFEGINLRFEGINLRFDELKQSSHKDALEIMRQMTALHERVAVVEAKQAK